MKNSTFLIILLAAGLCVMAYMWMHSASECEAPAGVANSTIEDIMTRSSVRSYSDRKVDSATVDTLLRAAMAAPTAGNKQPWRFVVIDDRAMLDTIAADFQTMTMAKRAQVAVIMCGDLTATFDGDGREYWVQDVSAASENLLLAAHALGLGAVWCGIYPIPERVAQFTQLLSLPEHIVPMACICIGYPDKEPAPKDKWKPEHVHYNGWN